MRYQIGALTESFPTHLAFVWLFPWERKDIRQHFHPKFHFCRLKKLYFHSRQHFVSFTCVDERVFLHIGFLVKSLSTVLAWVGSGVGVDEKMGGQSGWSFKTFPTDFTVKTSLLWGEKKVNFTKFNEYWTFALWLSFLNKKTRARAPVSEQLCVVPDWPRVRTFSHRCRKRKVLFHYATSGREPPSHEA